MTEIFNIDFKIFIPLIGVIIGWALTNLTGIFKGVSDKNKILAKSLVQLHFLYLDQKKILSLFEFLKDTHGVNSKYEEMRIRYVERYKYTEENFKIINQSIHELAVVYPTTAMRLKSIIESYYFSQKMTFTQSSKINQDLYIKLLSTYEVGFEMDNRELKKIILKIAYGHGFITLIKMKLNYHRIEKNQKKNIIKELGFDEELKKSIKNVTKSE